jgi:hypothetical protein
MTAELAGRGIITILGYHYIYNHYSFQNHCRLLFLTHHAVGQFFHVQCTQSNDPASQEILYCAQPPAIFLYLLQWVVASTRPYMSLLQQNRNASYTLWLCRSHSKVLINSITRGTISQLVKSCRNILSGIET